MFYTYIIRSISHPDQRYIGSTADLKSRLAKHNAGVYSAREMVRAHNKEVRTAAEARGMSRKDDFFRFFQQIRLQKVQSMIYYMSCRK